MGSFGNNSFEPSRRRRRRRRRRRQSVGYRSECQSKLSGPFQRFHLKTDSEEMNLNET